MYSIYFQLCIIEPNRIVGRNKPSLMDNIFFTEKLQAGSLTDKITDHMPNFLIIQNLAEEHLNNKTQIWDTKNFNKKEILKDLNYMDLLDFSDTYTSDEMCKFHDK